MALGLVGELQTLFEYKPLSIAMMERMSEAGRMRAPRKTPIKIQFGNTV
jgi:hypothetical protein